MSPVQAYLNLEINLLSTAIVSVFVYKCIFNLKDIQTLKHIYFAAAAAVTSVVSDSVRPHRQQPTRLPHPWDPPGKNTGVGCHFLL